jgi:hypothetical protein
MNHTQFLPFPKESRMIEIHEKDLAEAIKRYRPIPYGTLKVIVCPIALTAYAVLAYNTKNPLTDPFATSRDIVMTFGSLTTLFFMIMTYVVFAVPFKRWWRNNVVGYSLIVQSSSDRPFDLRYYINAPGVAQAEGDVGVMLALGGLKQESHIQGLSDTRFNGGWSIGRFSYKTESINVSLCHRKGGSIPLPLPKLMWAIDAIERLSLHELSDLVLPDRPRFTSAKSQDIASRLN